MKQIKRLLAAWAILIGLGMVPALAQGAINVVPQVGVQQSTIKQRTYSATAIGLVPASSATDIFCIANSQSKSVSVKEIDISGLATTAADPSFSILYRHILDTGGTSATTTANPANTAMPMVSNNPSPYTASLISYTANPTVNDSNPTYARSFYLTLPTSSNAVMPMQIVFGNSGTDDYAQALDLLKGVVGQYCINLGGVTVTGGTLDINIEWIEQ